MKHLFRRAAALFLAATMLVTSASAATIVASIAMGDELHQNDTPIANGATLTKQLIWSNSKSDLRTENYVTYTPGRDLKPLVYYGGTVLTKQTVSSMAKNLEGAGKRILSGTNGDYFDMGTGNPLGLLVTNGVLRSSASYLSAVGFTNDGEAVIGQPDLSIEASFSGHNLKVEGINKTRTSVGYFLYNSDFGSTTTNTEPGIDVILRPVTTDLGQTHTLANGRTVVQSEVLRIGGRMSFEVEEVLQSTGKVAIPQGKYVMSINAKGGDWVTVVLSSLQPGDTMDISITSADERWNNVSEAVGAMHRILNDGVVVSGNNDGASNASRTAIGVKADGSVIFYTIDGRQSGYSIGASISMVAERLKELGCVNAVCLDGGGSTTLVSTKPNEDNSTVINKPSEGSQRAVTNALFLVSTLSPSGGAAHIYVTPKDEVLAGGATTTFQTSFVDRNWFPSGSSEDVYFEAVHGSFSGNTYIAPTESCVDTITAMTDSGLTGSCTVTVFASPNAIRIRNANGQNISTLSMNAGESTTLSATATYQTIPLKTEGSNFTWSVEPASLGTITQNGVFTAAGTNGTGTIGVTSGNHKVTIALTVSADGRYRLLEGFESTTLSLPQQSGATLNLDSAGDQVRFGNKSLRWAYDLSGGASILSGSFALETNERYLSLWVYGDNSGGMLEATTSDIDGTLSTVSFGKLDFTGWKQLWAALPTNATTLTELRYNSANKTTGTLWLDQLTAANINKSDTTAPTVSLVAGGTTISATVKDNSDASFQQNQLTLTINGKNHPFTYSNGTLTAMLPALEGALYRVTVQAIDQSGNVGRASQILVGAGSASAFADMSGHWAISYTDCLSSLGIISGMPEKGKLYFYPNRSITRGDFALMTARWMGLDLDSYASVTLPFADTKKIPDWSLNAVKAMYELGIMKGVTDKNGLYANAGANITRAEAMTILGRIQIKGYPGTSLGEFKDAAQVADWAAPYVQSLVGQGVVSGYSDGTLKPGNFVSRAEVAKMLFTIW